MKTFANDSAGRRRAAFTLTEMMVTMALLVMVLGGTLYAHLFGVRLFEITKAKLGANDEARQAISLMIDEIRSGKLVKVGTADGINFTEVGVNTPQIGPAVQIYPTTETNTWVRYFWDEDDKQLKRRTHSDPAVAIVANSITNRMVFAAENFKGQVLTNNENNRVISLCLQFYQIQYPIIMIGPGHYYDFYQLRTKITRRAFSN